MSIQDTKKEFEKSFKDGSFYNKQTQDEKHLNDILKCIDIKPNMKILDLGCGTGYLSFPMARLNPNAEVVALDIVTETLMRNTESAKEQGLSNLSFVNYDGITFPFEAASFDLVVTRYALHHFPQIEKSLQEVARVLKENGSFFISDPRPNDDDITGFVDDYMQMKKDGHIKFYSKTEWVDLCKRNRMILSGGFDSQIRFPKKKNTAIGFEDILKRHDRSIIEGYCISETEDEIWITEQVNNLLFKKN